MDPTNASAVLKALSNPSRLRIFLRLRKACPVAAEPSDVCVGDVSHDLGISSSTVSHHLRELEHAGLIRTERRGKNVICRVLCEPVSDVVEFLSCDVED